MADEKLRYLVNWLGADDNASRYDFVVGDLIHGGDPASLAADARRFKDPAREPFGLFEVLRPERRSERCATACRRCFDSQSPASSTVMRIQQFLVSPQAVAHFNRAAPPTQGAAKKMVQIPVRLTQDAPGESGQENEKTLEKPRVFKGLVKCTSVQVGDTGLEQGSYSPGKTPVSESVVPNHSPFGPGVTIPTDPAFALLAGAWPNLTDADRKVILAIVRQAARTYGK